MNSTEKHQEEQRRLTPDRDEIRRTLRVLFQSGDVVEMRAFKEPRCTISGYYADFEKLAQDAARWNSTVGAIYVTLNRVNADLLARRANRCEQYASTTTSDDQVIRRNWLPIDLDPVRPAGISASDREHDAAIDKARQVRKFLVGELGWPEPVAADSGNGGHLLSRIDLPNDEQSTQVVQAVLRALDLMFSDDQVVIDTANYNAARIWKLYGTTARKGDHTEDRPHRLAKLLHVPDDIKVVPIEKLRELAAMAPQPETSSSQAGTTIGSFDLGAWIADHKLDVAGPHPWQGGRKWVFRVCPWNPEHTNKSAFIVQRPDGPIGAGCHHNSCTGKGWHHLRDVVEPGWRDKQRTSVSSVSSSPGPVLESWREPQPVPDELPPVAPFDIDLLPRLIGPWIADIARRAQCPIDFPAVAAMIGLAGVVGRKVGIRPKRKDDWLVVPNLWGACIGRPGIMKTPAIQEPLKPLKRLEIMAKERFDEELADYAAAKIVADQRKKVAEQQIRKAMSDGSDPEAIARTLFDEQAAPPVRRRYLVNDSTVEKLGEILKDNPCGVVCYRDELVGLLRSLDKEAQEGARAFYLESWNGNGRFTYDRIGRGTIDIEAAIVSIVGGITPGPLGDYLRIAMESGKGDDGLMQRFQLAVWPEVSRDWVNVDEWPDSMAKSQAYEVFTRLDGLNPDDVGAVEDDDPGTIPHLRFSDEAQSLFDTWRADLEKKIRSSDEAPAIESHLAKYRSLIPSIALLVYLADDGVGPVGIKPLKRAIEWGRYLETHARRIFSSAVNRDIHGAKSLGKKILSGALEDGFSLRDVYRPCWTGLTTRDEAVHAVEILMDLEWLAEAKEPTKGATRTTYRINPKIYEMATKGTDKTDKRPSEPLLSVLSVPSGERSGFSAAGGELEIEEVNRLFDRAAQEEDPNEVGEWRV